MDKLDLLIKSRRVVLESGVYPLSIGVADGRIACLAAYDCTGPAVETIDVGELMVFPGAVDPHVHLKEPGPRTHREDWESGTKQAAAGGVTTVIEMPLSIPLTVDKAGFDAKMAIATKKSIVDFALWGGMNKFAEGHYDEMHELGCVAYKVFLSTDPDSPRLGDYDFLRALRDVAKFNGLVGVHCENADIIDSMCEEFEKSGRLDGMAHKDSRPDVAEVEAVQRALLFAKEAGARMHICHLSSAQTSDIMRFYAEQGVDFTVETCHSYLVLDDSVLTRCGAHAKFNPPIRAKENGEKLWQMIRQGQVTMVGSDHSPYVDEDRELPLWQAPPGLSGIDLMFPLMVDEALHNRGLTPSQLSALMSVNTCRRFGLYPRKGAIQVGADADLAIIDPDAEWTFTWKNSLGKSKEKATPYEGRKIRGKIVSTFVRGAKVYDGDKNEVLVQPGNGEFIRPIR
ncbi:MAG: allantoinase AllB [Planctomycetes bacterium]|nr:allantoinase AllB [Planctomycetota bacterium]